MGYDHIFVTADQHFGHVNLILPEYCNRPFSCVEEMDETMLNRWNEVVGEKDLVYFLGDMSFGKGSKKPEYWLEKLNGSVFFLKGSHDKSKLVPMTLSTTLSYNGYEFFLTHNPINVPKIWNNWSICGHHHNNDMEEFPFINGNTRMINVSVELTDYHPVSIDEIVSLDLGTIKGWTI